MLALARALSRSPRLLLIDELSLGLAPRIVERLMPVLRDYADSENAGVLLVEQHVAPRALDSRPRVRPHAREYRRLRVEPGAARQP